MTVKYYLYNTVILSLYRNTVIFIYRNIIFICPHLFGVNMLVSTSMGRLVFCVCCRLFLHHRQCTANSVIGYTVFCYVVMYSSPANYIITNFIRTWVILIFTCSTCLVGHPVISFLVTLRGSRVFLTEF